MPHLRPVRRPPPPFGRFEDEAFEYQGLPIKGQLACLDYIPMQLKAGFAIAPPPHHQFSRVTAGRAHQLSLYALPHTYRRSSGTVRVPTNNQVELRAVQSQAGNGLAGR